MVHKNSVNYVFSLAVRVFTFKLLCKVYLKYHIHVTCFHNIKLQDLNERLKKQFLADLDSLRRELDQIKESCIAEMERVDKDSVKELQTKQTSLEKKIETVQKLLEHHENLQTDPANSIEVVPI